MLGQHDTTIQWSEIKFAFSPEVNIWPAHQQGELVYSLEVKSTGKFYRLKNSEYAVLSMLDGNRTIPHVCGIVAKTIGANALSMDEATELVRWAIDVEIVSVADSQSSALDGNFLQEFQKNENDSKHGPDTTKGRGAMFNPFWIEFSVPGSTALLNFLAKHLEFLASRTSILLGSLTIASALIGLLISWDSFWYGGTTIVHKDNWIWLFLTWFGLKCLHETAHAVTCHRFTGSVGRCGFALVFLAPMAFVDVTSSWRLASRFQRIAIALAGMFAECIVASLAFWIWQLTDDLTLSFHCRNIVFTATIGTLVFNANFLMRFDGYYILSDLVDFPNLYSESQALIKDLLRSGFTGQRTDRKWDFTTGNMFLFMYAVAAFLWRISIYIAILASSWTLFAGTGKLFVVVAITLWWGEPLYRWMRECWDSRRSNPNGFSRAMISTATVFLAAWFFVFALPIPHAVRANATVRYLPEATVRNAVSGWVQSVEVDDGDTVQRGDPLLILKNEQLSQQLSEDRLRLEQAFVRVQQAIMWHDNSSVRKERLKIESLQKQIGQLESQINLLSIVAPRTGRVHAPRITESIGTFVSAGTPLLVVGNEHQTEIVAYVDEKSIQSVHRVRKTPVRIHTQNLGRSNTRIDAINPSATTTLSETWLASHFGGSLTVKQIENSSQAGSFELVDPHFVVRLHNPRNDNSVPLPPGMRLKAEFGFRTETLFKSLCRCIESLVE